MIGGFQCTKPRHMPDFQKICPDICTGAEKEDVFGETWMYGNPNRAT